MAGNIFIIIFILIILALVALGIFISIKHRENKDKGQSILKRNHRNPLLSPKFEHYWENVATFNPAAIKDDNDNVHILYRAIGSDGVSRIGYDSSEDGIHFNNRLAYPVFTMDNPRNNIKNVKPEQRRYDPILYASGGSWGGCEDPRMVRIDGKIYVTFNAFDGWDFIRIATISIDEKDFFEKRWKWTKPLLISPPNQVHKNWVLFPEKIKGKFAILHSIVSTNPDLAQVDLVDRLEDLDSGRKKIISFFKQKDPRKTWDAWLRGVGPPPIKTDRGWLVIYHAMNKKERHRYKLGALLLDLEDPRKIIGRLPEPLLMPDMWYENDWKPGIVYACGAVIKGKELYVYYGGGDKYVCVASAPLQEILDEMIK